MVFSERRFSENVYVNDCQVKSFPITVFSIQDEKGFLDWFQENHFKFLNDNLRVKDLYEDYLNGNNESEEYGGERADEVPF